MQAEDLIIISVDDHVVEPPDIFERHLPPKYRDIAPARSPQGRRQRQWSFCGINIPNVGLNAVAGRPKEEYGLEPTSFDELRPGCFDVHERIKDMSAGGVLGVAELPVDGRSFAGRLFAQLEDKDAALALLRAYNDWHIEDWCGSYPGRFIPLSIPPLWDPHLAAVEIHRVAAKGCHAVSFVENPVPLGFPSLHSDHWDPFWQACADDAVTVCMHIGSSSKLPMHRTRRADRRRHHAHPAEQPARGCRHHPLADLPEVPRPQGFALRGRYRLGPLLPRAARPQLPDSPRVDRRGLRRPLPSEVFLDHVLLCYITDGVGVRLARDLGIGNITVEVDYPHSDSSWPHSPEALWKDFEGSDLTDDEIHRVTHRNAMEWFHFDPFEARPPERSTAAALRAEVEGHDVSIRARGKSNRSALRMGDLEKAAAGASLNAVPS